MVYVTYIIMYIIATYTLYQTLGAGITWARTLLEFATPGQHQG